MAEPTLGGAAVVVRTAERPGDASLRYWRADAWISAGVLVLLVTATTAALWGWGGAALLLAAAPLVLGGVVAAVLVPRARAATHRWLLTDDDVVSEFGVVIRRRRVTALARVQTVDRRQGPLQRRFGVEDLVVTTASSAGAVVVPAIDSERARSLERWIRRALRDAAGDDG